MTTWRKSRKSCPGNACVEVAFRQALTINVLVRDSKDPDGPVLEFTPGEWSRFLHRAKAGEFDPLTDLPFMGDQSW
jgi:Domain of unknown function (DUF397)